ncbi:hypothetical protein [Carboxylicivirga sp. M1479]|uniref:hypothetical protein n=1 Tax=Carboxylicivirga sp. M1479 TaxID=2594476 RepID=UPI001177DEFF|nr:hypothetical protein [Carboxylicivirga sp. M1479]TRX72381.1 hypothetical protein FNN09_00120 [Carboxylicivirga sp. M1479]
MKRYHPILRSTLPFLVAILICHNSFADEKIKNVTYNHFGMDIGIGINNFSAEEDKYTKATIDLGLSYELKEKVVFGFDLAFSPMEEYENTGTDGSRSTHEKWDSKATCIEAYLGYHVLNRLFVLGGFGSCIIKEYEVMKGYSNLTAYERSEQTLYSPTLGLMYDFPVSYGTKWYLKYDCSLNHYNRHCINIGYKF